MLSLLYLLGGVQALFITVYLVLKENRKKVVNICLALTLFGLFLTLYDYYIIENSLHDRVSHFLLLGYVFQLAYGPLTYFIIKGSVLPSKKVKLQELFHFLPAVIHLIYGILTFHILTLDQKVDYLEQFINGLNSGLSTIHLPYLIFTTIIAFQQIIYLLMSYVLVKKYKSQQKFKNGINRKTLWRFYWSLLGVNLILLFAYLNLVLVYFTNWNIHIGPLALTVLSLYLFYIAYFILFNQRLFEPPEIKYQTSSLDHTQKTQIIDRLEQVMNATKIYRNAELTINDLSKEMNIPSRQLSQSINEHYGYNFYDFLNSFRIKEAQTHLKNDTSNKYSILGIAYDVGFNSKSSFYSAFKKFTGMTPSAYRKKPVK